MVRFLHEPRGHCDNDHRTIESVCLGVLDGDVIDDRRKRPHYTRSGVRGRRACPSFVGPRPPPDAACLLCSQGRRRIDPSDASRGNVAGDERHGHEQQGRDAVRPRIEGGHLEQEALQEA